MPPPCTLPFSGGSAFPRTMEYYNATSGSWTLLRNLLLLPRQRHSMVGVGDSFVVLGGVGVAGFSVEMHNCTTGQGRMLPRLAARRVG